MQGHTLTQGVARLDHEALDDAVEDDAIVVAVARVRGKILHGLGAVVGEQLEVHISFGGVQDSPPGEFPPALPSLLCSQDVVCRRLLIEDIPAAAPCLRDQTAAMQVSCQGADASSSRRMSQCTQDWEPVRVKQSSQLMSLGLLVWPCSHQREQVSGSEGSRLAGRLEHNSQRKVFSWLPADQLFQAPRPLP